MVKFLQEAQYFRSQLFPSSGKEAPKLMDPID